MVPFVISWAFATGFTAAICPAHPTLALQINPQPDGQRLHSATPPAATSSTTIAPPSTRLKSGAPPRQKKPGWTTPPRRRPGCHPSAAPTANGILFLSLEDETGLLDIIVKPDLSARARPTLRTHALLVIAGTTQRNGAAVSLLATAITSLDAPIASNS